MLLKNLDGQSVLGDADFSWYLMQDKNMFRDELKNLKKVIITPNIVEFKRMYEHSFKKEFPISVLDNFLNNLENKDEVFQI